MPMLIAFCLLYSHCQLLLNEVEGLQLPIAFPLPFDLLWFLICILMIAYGW
jgi:hypothetical protein